MKDQGIIKFEWISNKDISADMFTTNLAGLIFSKYVKVCCSKDNYSDNKFKRRVLEAKIEA